LFIRISQVIGCEDCLRNDLDFVGWDVKLYFTPSSVPVQGHSTSQKWCILEPKFAANRKL